MVVVCGWCGVAGTCPSVPTTSCDSRCAATQRPTSPQRAWRNRDGGRRAPTPDGSSASSRRTARSTWDRTRWLSRCSTPRLTSLWRRSGTTVGLAGLLRPRQGQLDLLGLVESARHSAKIRQHAEVALVLFSTAAAVGMYIEVRAEKDNDPIQLERAVRYVQSKKQPDKFSANGSADVSGDAEGAQRLHVVVARALDAIDSRSTAGNTCR
jgi:hypothetical protein